MRSESKAGAELEKNEAALKSGRGVNSEVRKQGRS